MNLINIKFGFCQKFPKLIIYSKYSNNHFTRGRTFRYLKLDEVGDDAIEGMALLEERRKSKRIREAEERAKRRAKGIMFDEENIGNDGKVKFLYSGEYKELYEVDKDIWKLMKFILVAMALGVIGFIYVKADLTKRRRRLMIERKKKLAEIHKLKESQKSSKQIATI
uniref:Uncharacterized protein n=1 Tax=Meloidogyne hapla TaxID=6305 RepID=A0A1I8B8F2_MELHA